MSLKNILLNFGLTKYESEALLYILNNGIVEAGEISKKTMIPYGKIYETLNQLENYGFLEIQYTRPKKYRIKAPNLAIEEFLETKRITFDEELNNYRKMGNQFLDAVKTIDLNKEQSPVFWRTAIGKDIHDLYQSTIKEAEKEIIFFSPHTIYDLQFNENMINSHNKDHSEQLINDTEFITNIIEQMKNHIKIKILFAGQTECPYFKNNFLPLLETIPSAEVRAIPNEIVTPPLMLIDKTITMFEIVDPIDNHSTLGITKIYDRQLTEKIREKLMLLWEKSNKYFEVFA